MSEKQRAAEASSAAGSTRVRVDTLRSFVQLRKSVLGDTRKPTRHEQLVQEYYEFLGAQTTGGDTKVEQRGKGSRKRVTRNP